MSTITNLFNTDPSSGDRPGTFTSAVLEALQLLEKTFYSSSAPASPVNGQIWIDSSTPSRLVGNLRQNGAWAAMVLTHILEQNLDFDLNEAINFRLENTGSLPTPGASTEGQVVYNESDKEVYFVTDSAVKRLQSSQTGATEKGIPAQIPSIDQIFDGTGDTAALRCIVPDGWDEASDPQLELFYSLEQAETDGDDADWIGDFRSISFGDSRNKSQTTTAEVNTDLGAGLSSGDTFSTKLVLDHDDATNPIAIDDLLEVEVRRPDLAEVGAVKLIAARFLFRGDWND